MWGAIAGDIIGSIYEFDNVKSTDFPLFNEESFFTDDTILTIAVADSILNDKPIASTLKEYFSRYPNGGYGNRFIKWAYEDSVEPYNSYGNGAAMRISPVAYAFNSLNDVLKAAEMVTIVTHNHPEGIKGAKATATAIYLARNGSSKLEIKNHVERNYGYNLSRTCDAIRPTYSFDESCQGSIPEAILAFLESTDFESAIRLAVSLGGDSDTISCISGSIAEPFYGGVPEWIREECEIRLDEELMRIVSQFTEKYIKDIIEPV